MVTIEDVAVSPGAVGERIDVRALFGDEHQLELEIGCGKGGFLLRQAKAHPERNYLGIEWANKFYRFAADRMARWCLENVRILRADAKHFVMQRLPPASLAAIHIYHPDPWPKKRHHKRRLLTADFVEAAIRVLASGGRLAIQTDHADYFDQIQSVTQQPMLVPVAFDDPDFGIVGESADTNFEIKYRREGRTFYRLAFRRK